MGVMHYNKKHFFINHITIISENRCFSSLFKNIYAIPPHVYSANIWHVPPQTHIIVTPFAKMRANDPYVPGALIHA